MFTKSSIHGHNTLYYNNINKTSIETHEQSSQSATSFENQWLINSKQKEEKSCSCFSKKLFGILHSETKSETDLSD